MAQPQEHPASFQPHHYTSPPCYIFTPLLASPTPPWKQPLLPLPCPLATHYFTERFSPYSLVMMDCMRKRLSCRYSTHGPSSANSSLV